MADKTFIFTLLFCLLLLTKAQDSVSAYIQTSHDQPTPETVLDTTSSDQRNTRQDIFPIQTPEIYGFILLMLFAGLANSGGLGGGTLLTPLLIIVFNYSEKNAVEMVYALVFGGSVGNFINLVTKRNPKTNKPLIEYDLGLVCMPLMLLGATIGVILNRMLAPLVTLAGLLAVILYSLTRMYIKARKQYADETKQILQDALVVKKEINSELSQALNSDSIQDQLQDVNPELQAILKEDQLLFPKKKLAVTGSLIGIIILLALFRGTQSFDSIVGVPYCGAVYWLIVALTVVICAIALWINLRLLKGPLRIKKEHGLIARPGRFELTEDQIGKLIMLSLIAGILAGLLGIGGGMVMGPTLISIGVPAQGLAATSGFFIVQTSFISLVQACLYKDLPLQDQGFLMLLAIIGSFGVSYVLNRLVRKYKRPSLVLFTLMLVLTTSLIATPVFEILTNLHNFGMMMSFSPVC